MNPMGYETQDCQLYVETNQRTFSTEIECDKALRLKADEMLGGFSAMNVPFTTMQFGCENKPD